MKKNITKFLPAIIVTSILAINGVFAQDLIVEQIYLNNEDEVFEEEYTQESVLTSTINVELIQENENLFFPVREVFEKLGYEVNYEPIGKVITITKGSHFITFSTTKNAYVFSRMMPQQLEQAPVIKDGVSFIPLTLLTQIMQMEGVSVEGTILTIIT